MQRACGIDRIGGGTFEVQAHAIIFAGGPFTDSLREMESESSTPAVSGAAGTHVVLPGYYAPPGIGMLDINTSDGRFLFSTLAGSTLVGTTIVRVTLCRHPNRPGMRFGGF